MATVQHPMPTRTHVHHNLEWLWVGLSVILVALIAGAIAWVVFRPAATVPALPAEVVGFEYTQEATAGMVAQPGATGEYFGNSGELYPALSVVPAATGFAYDHEVTLGHMASPGVTGQYFGNGGELYPALTVVPAATGFAYDHEVTIGHVAELAPIGEYFGSSGEINPER